MCEGEMRKLGDVCDGDKLTFHSFGVLDLHI